VVTDRNLAGSRSEEEVVNLALRGGVRVFQYREKERSTRYQVELGARLCQLVHQYQGIFMVNDRVDIARSIQADGVHLGQEDLPITMARSILGPDKIIGVSVSNVQQAIQAEAEGADYVGASALFSTATKAEALAMGLPGLKQIRQAIGIPILAIGGIGVENASAVTQAGADGLAVVSAIVSAEDITQAAANLLRIIRDAKVS